MDRAVIIVVAIEILCDLGLWHELMCYIMTKIDVEIMINVMIHHFHILHKYYDGLMQLV